MILDTNYVILFFRSEAEKGQNGKSVPNKFFDILT